MIDIGIALIILLIHWFSDFIMQTDEMGKKKSSDNQWLAYHVITYTFVSMVLWMGLVMDFNIHTFLLFGMITYTCHFYTDYVTSRITGYYYKKGDNHNFFVVIGFDQVLHFAQLFYTYKYLTNL